MTKLQCDDQLLNIEGKRKLNTLDNLINELQKAVKEAPSQLANKEWNILKSQIATSNSPEDKAFSDPDCKKSLGNIGLTSEHSEYFETFCRKSRKSRLISDFICNFAGWIIK